MCLCTCTLLCSRNQPVFRVFISALKGQSFRLWLPGLPFLPLVWSSCFLSADGVHVDPHSTRLRVWSGSSYLPLRVAVLLDLTLHETFGVCTLESGEFVGSASQIPVHEQSVVMVQDCSNRTHVSSADDLCKQTFS